MKLYQIRGEWWICYLAPNGRLYMVRKCGELGDRVAP
jgi:hypothetical protein